MTNRTLLWPVSLASAKGTRQRGNETKSTRQIFYTSYSILAEPNIGNNLFAEYFI